jgi:isoleucyl-tRNA synthetase
VVVWTTTPWTLPANVAAAVHPEAEYILSEGNEWVARERFPDSRAVRVARGEELLGLRYEGPFDHLPAAAQIEHQVVPWDGVTLEEGTGIVHIAPGCGQEDFELGRALGLPVLTPIDEAGRFYPEYGWLHGLGTADSADQIVADLSERGRVAASEEIVHRYPHCWRCQTPLAFRLSDDWFIAVDELRPLLLEANASVRWVPEYMGRRMDDWLLNISTFALGWSLAGDTGRV